MNDVICKLGKNPVQCDTKVQHLYNTYYRHIGKLPVSGPVKSCTVKTYFNKRMVCV
jgi:hypothetical protein